MELPLELAVVVPIAVFIARLEWSSYILPVVAFVVAFGIAVVAAAGQLKRRRKTPASSP